MDSQTRKRMIHKQKRDIEKREMAYLENISKIANKYREKNVRKVTLAELALYRILCSMPNIRFVYQKPLRESRRSQKFYIADFYILPPHRIVIEADGEYHESTKEYDAVRDSIMERHGVKVMRFTNAEILNNTNRVRIKIELATASKVHLR